MSRFDMLGSWMAGSQLGQQQYAQLAGMAQNEALLRQRQAEEAAQREQFAARQALDQQQFGEQQRMNTATLGRWDQQTAWENENRAIEAEIRRQEQEDLQMLKDYTLQQLYEAADGAGRRGEWTPDELSDSSFLPRQAVDASAAMMNPGSIGGVGVPEGMARGMPKTYDNHQMPKSTRLLAEMIRRGSGATLRAISPHVNEFRKQRDLRRKTEEMMKYFGGTSLLSDPNDKELVSMLIQMGDPDAAFKELATAAREQRRRKAEEQAAAQKMAEEQRARDDAAGALPRLRTNTSTNRDADFAIARDAGLVNQEAVNISGRAGDYKRSPEYEVAKLEMEAAADRLRVSNSAADREAYDAAVKRLIEVIRGDQTPSAPVGKGEAGAGSVNDLMDSIAKAETPEEQTARMDELLNKFDEFVKRR